MAVCKLDYARPACSGDAAPEFAKDEEIILFAGKAPQIKDWSDAWAEVSSSVSSLKPERVALKKGERLKRKQRIKLRCVVPWQKSSARTPASDFGKPRASRSVLTTPSAAS